MKHNLFVWCAHSCRQDVFMDELARGNLPYYESVLKRGLFMPNVMVGGHFQQTSNLSEITGRHVTSSLPFEKNILNTAKDSGAFVGVVDDSVIAMGAERLVSKGLLENVSQVYPNLIERPWFDNLARPRIDFRPDVDHERWLYWYRERSTHRNFYNFACSFKGDGGFLEDIVNENPEFVHDQQRYSLRLQDKWFGNSLEFLEEKGALDDAVILVFSTHGTSLEGWLDLVGRVTRATVDHAAFNFHPNVIKSFAFLAGPGIKTGTCERWISTLDLKPTLCRFLEMEDAGGSVYGVDLLSGTGVPDSRVLADITSPTRFCLYDTKSSCLLMSVPRNEKRGATSELGLPPTENGLLVFYLDQDPGCAMPDMERFHGSVEMQSIREEVRRLDLRHPALRK